MKFITTVEKFKTMISALEKITSKNAALPILNTIYLQMSDNKLLARATNLHVGAEYTLSVKGDGEWKCAVPSATLRPVLNSLPSGESIEVTFDGSVLSMKAGPAFMKLTTESPDEFPTLPQVQDADICTIPSEILVQGIQSVVYAASLSDIKPEIASVYMYTDGNDLVFVSTDTFRLAEKKFHLKKPVDGLQVLIPARNAIELVRLCDGVDSDIELHYTKHQLSLYADTMYCTTRVVDGVFPDYRQIIPKEFTTEMKVLKEELHTTLKLSDVFSNKFHEISMSIDPEKKECVVVSKNSGVGEQEYTLHATITGEPIDIHMNQRYLVESLGSLGSDSVVFLLSKSRPLIVRGSTDTSFTYLIMPMNR